jgi:DNA-binding response OmpR family regulator
MGHVLIVEDNPDIGLLYQRALMRHEHTIVRTAEHAYKALEKHSYDLIILDMHLPEDSGLQVLEHIREGKADKQTPVLVISADDLLRKSCEKFGIQAWMTKPIELDKFMDVAGGILDKPRPAPADASPIPDTQTKPAIQESSLGTKKTRPLLSEEKSSSTTPSSPKDDSGSNTPAET